MTIVDGWFDRAVRDPGPRERQQRFNNTMQFITFHSMEGRRGGYNVMLDPKREGIAWHGTIGYNGVLYQHYPVFAGLYHGGPNANPYSPGFELEGGIDDEHLDLIDEPATPAQTETVLYIIREMEDYLGRSLTRANGGIREHGELAQTSCPSGRYNEVWKLLEEDMTKDEVLSLIKELQDSGALASTTDVLACMAQIVGVEPNTYSDKSRIEKVRKGIIKLVLPNSGTPAKVG